MPISSSVLIVCHPFPVERVSLQVECAISLHINLLVLLSVDGEGGEEGEAGEVSSEVKEVSPSENADQEVITEALKSICNILLHNQTGQVSL